MVCEFRGSNLNVTSCVPETLLYIDNLGTSLNASNASNLTEKQCSPQLVYHRIQGYECVEQFFYSNGLCDSQRDVHPLQKCPGRSTQASTVCGTENEYGINFRAQ